MKVLIVDDHVLFREGLDGILRARPEFEVVGEAGTVSKAVEIARQHKHCLILMDWALPDGDGAQATQQILAESPESKIVFLTIYEADENLFAAIRSGAKGYLLKNISSKKLVQALLDVEQGKPALSRAMTARLMEGFSQTSTEAKPSNKPFEKLSTREMEVLGEVVNGAPNREIAQTLFISENTVKHHMHNILEKLGVENRHQAAKYARQYGLR
jgi:two-component system nitrate/nitrite response regulator NarL